MPVDTSTLDAQIKKIKTAYEGKEGGTGLSIQMGDEAQHVERISTGSFELDWATCGGLPIGRVTRLYGGFSSGKSLCCWNTIRNAQKKGMTCAYYNIEKQFDEIFVRSMGVDVTKLVVVQGSTIERTAVKLEGLMRSVHLHVLDSCSSAVSLEEMKANVEDWQMGMKSRVWGKVLLRVMEKFDENENMLIQVDQIRDNFGGQGQNAVSPPGGHLMEHNSSMTLFFLRSAWLFRTQKGFLDYEGESRATLHEGVEPAGQEIQVKVNKNRVGRPFRQARMRYDFGEKNRDGTVSIANGMDLVYELAKAAKYFRVVEVSGNWLKYDGKSYNGLGQFRQAITDNPDLARDIVDAMKNDY